MLRQAIASDDPVIFFEPKRRYHVKAEVDDAVAPAEAPALGAARVAFHPGPDRPGHGARKARGQRRRGHERQTTPAGPMRPRPGPGPGPRDHPMTDQGLTTCESADGTAGRGFGPAWRRPISL